jgi:hypothetical protein
LQALACSLRRSNPGLPLIVLAAEGDLQPETLEAVRQFGQLHIVPDFSIPNFNLPRYVSGARQHVTLPHSMCRDSCEE